MTVKTDVSRFHIHDELTAPDGSAPLIKSIQTAGGAVSKFIGVLAESPSALRGYTRLRTELRSSKLPRATRERIGLAVAGSLRSAPALAQHERTARTAGLGVDEIAAARAWSSRDEREAAMLRYLKPLAEQHGSHPVHLHEEAHEAGWTDEQLLEAIALVSMESFTAMINLAGEIPVDGSVEETRLLRAA